VRPEAARPKPKPRKGTPHERVTKTHSTATVPLTLAARADAAPAPEVEYVYDVVVRRHYGFPNNDALAYGHGICDKVSRGEGYGQVIGDVKSDVTPSDEFAANYLVSYAVNLLCPDLIWQLRNSAAGYQPPGGVEAPGTYY
jgi:Protein of unknown function (DUF732)